MTYVKTKKCLKKAVKQGDTEIIITGKLAKKMKGFVKLKKLSKKEKAALIAFLTGSGATAVAAIALAAPTGGLSVAGATAALVAAAPAAGVSIGAIIVIIGLLGAIGLTTIALLKEYDCKVRYGKDGNVELGFTKHDKQKND